jgi:hypothetical protein
MLLAIVQIVRFIWSCEIQRKPLFKHYCEMVLARDLFIALKNGWGGFSRDDKRVVPGYHGVLTR